MRNALARVAGCMLLLAGCTEHTVTTRPMPTEPDSHFRLSTGQRAELRAGVNIDALERMLTRLPPERREELLGYFVQGTHKGVIGSDNPDLQRLVEEIWGPSMTTSAGRDSPEGALPRERRGELAIVVVLVPKLDAPAAGALVVRKPGEMQDWILLERTGATPAQLFRAIRILMESRITRGYPSAAPMRIAVEKTRIPTGPDAAETERMVLRTYGAIVDELLSTRPSPLAGFGNVQWIQLDSLDRS